jgi:glycolate oxidase FAD binding subunit
MTIHSPTSDNEVVAIVRDARESKTTLAIEGGGTRAGLGRPSRAAAILSTRGLTGITLYEPAEMVISAKAGTPLREIEAALAEKAQCLPFEPMDSRSLYGSTGESTIGAVAACNISGPRRAQSGAARDHLIGVRLVNGRGEIIKSGGRVMKNVTGLDLVKLNAGAMGTLGVLTEVTFKLTPAPRASGTLMFERLDDARAITCLCAAMGTPFEVSGAAHLPKGVGGDVARTLLRIEHFPESVEYRLGRLADALAAFGKPTRLDENTSQAIWLEIRDVVPLAEPRDRAIWKLSVAPTHGAKVVSTVAKKIDARWFYDWSGGLIWLAVAPGGDCGASVVRGAVAMTGGHATLVRAPGETRARVDMFQPLAEPLMKLTRGIKASFDPDGVLNAGRMYAGI